MKERLQETMKKVIMLLMAFVMALSLSAGANLQKADAATSFAQLQSKYPSGSLWNGSYHNKAWQCHGFACTLGEALTGRDPYTWTKVYHLNSLKAGDIVRCNRPHSIMVTSVSGNTITYVDCNWVGRNKVMWNQKIARSKITSKFGSLAYVMSAPNGASAGSGGGASAGSGGSAAAQPAALPSITNVGIDSIDANHITFHFTANHAALAKVVIESRNTGQNVSYSYTSGLNHISHTFFIDALPGTTEMYVRIYAYTTTSGGNETLHNVLYGNIPNVVQLPQDVPTGLERMCFDAVYYADHNADVKAVYGYNEANLYAHWKAYGIAEGRESSPIWNPAYYLDSNADLKLAYGTDYAAAYNHFCSYGYNEYRQSSAYYYGNYYKNTYYGEFRDRNSEQLLAHYREFGLKEGRSANTVRYTGGSSWK